MVLNTNNLTATITITVEEKQSETPSKETLLALIKSAKEKVQDARYTQASRDAGMHSSCRSN
ncbi:hypothetical protein [Hydrogenoanaerobacterium saccharovorans]|uniref:hypothetical protein n=1 Tax=Hydrogenoanaerobacterium saccharovorans TaxID=474960 RepID=UPI000B808B7C|nr:hypothetical protein [Hydrogenoanaerobacterium saccharovorans]